MCFTSIGSLTFMNPLRSDAFALKVSVDVALQPSMHGSDIRTPINVASMASGKMICGLATTMQGTCLSISEDAMLCHAIDFNQFSRAKSPLRRYMTTSEAVPSYLSRL